MESFDFIKMKHKIIDDHGDKILKGEWKWIEKHALFVKALMKSLECKARQNDIANLTIKDYSI